MKSRVITVSAIAAGLVAISLALGVYLGFADIFALVVSSAFVILPTYLKSYKGAVLAYLVGGLLGVIFGWFNFLYSFVFPAYFVFFGIYPILSCFLREKRIKKRIYYLIGILWCVAAFYGIYFYYIFIMNLDFYDLPQSIAWIKNYIIYAVGVLGLVFYFVYDRFIVVVKTLIDRYLNKIIK